MSFELSDRDYAHFYFEEIDLEAQLLAIRAALARQAKADATLSDEIIALAARAQAARDEAGDHLVGRWTDEVHGSVYQDAAHSAAAVGMLAPLIESLFLTIFRGIEKMGIDRLGEPGRGERAARAGTEFWNGKLYYGKTGPREDLPLGIRQLAEASGLADYLPADFAQVVNALFLYRNRMLHSGFEWPVADRAKFARAIVEQRFPEGWFERALTNGEPWIFYMSEELILRVLTLVDDVLTAAGRQLRAIDAAAGDGPSSSQPTD